MILPLVVLDTPAKLPDIAYCARYYFQGARKSYYRVFLCRADGTHRRQLNWGATSAVTPIWRDRYHLYFTEVDGQIPESQYGEIHYKALVIDFNVRTGLRRVVARANVVDPSFLKTDNELTLLGFPSPHGADSKWTFATDVSQSDDYGQMVTGKGIVPGVSFIYKRYFQEIPGAIQVQVLRGSEVANLSLKGGGIDTIFARSSRQFYIVTGNDFDRFQKLSFVYRYNWDQKPELVLENVGHVNFSPDCYFWFGTDVQRRILNKLKDGRQVWCDGLYSGNWRTGKRWTIATGLVNVWEYSIRPSK